MKIINLFIIISLLTTGWCFADPSERRVITSPKDLKELIENNNFSAKLLKQQAMQAKAIVDGVRGSYYPVLSTGANYSDDKKEPTSTFQPARVKNEHFNFSLHQRTPVGVSGSIGFTNDRTELFQSQPPNNMLPYPETYKQPLMYVKLEVDVLENFMGYISRRQWDQAELDEKAMSIQSELIQDQLYLTSSVLFWNLQAMEEMKTLIIEILGRLKRLERDVENKSLKRIADPSDVYKLKASIAKRELDIIAIDKNIENSKKVLFEIVSLPKYISIESSKSLLDIQEEIRHCENYILNLGEMTHSWSNQFDVLEARMNRAHLEQKILNRRILPDVKLFASYAQTGTDTDKDRSYTEMLHGDKPQSMVGVNFTLELSPSLRKSAKMLGDIEYINSNITYSQFFHESKAKYFFTRRSISNMQKENELITNAMDYELKQIEDINRRYKQGRVSLFELVSEEGAVLETKLQQKELWMQRVENVYQFLGHFDNIECGSINL